MDKNPLQLFEEIELLEKILEETESLEESNEGDED